jgi:asparagine synthase (glutamine-hydrolysing)
MCGIAGVVSPDPAHRLDPTVRGMLAALEHRGPDEEGLGASGIAALGSRRLAIIDLADGHQPMANEDGSVLAVQNGEIYNYLDLRDELRGLGHRLRTRSDTEVLPHAWEQWGPEMVTRLHGMFALAIWDAPRRTLMLARDRFGKKPLLYARTPSGVVFASEIQALLAHPAVVRSVDDDAIADYLAIGHVPAPGTAFTGIRKVPPGHVLIWRHEAEPEVRRYWALRYGPKERIDPAEAMVEVRRLIDRAVERRLISDVPLGAFLSGGLDSSTVVAYMARHASAPVRTFSVTFRDTQYDESRYARLAARTFGTEHLELTVDASDVEALPMLARHLGEPFADSSIVPTYQIARATRPHVTVVLTGDGGDELFAGYDRYRAAVIADRIPRPAGAVLAGLGQMLPAGAGQKRLTARLRRFLVALGADAEGRRAEWTGYFAGRSGDLLLDARDPGRSTAGALDRAVALTGADTPAERYMAADVLGYLPDDLLVKMDIATMACSLEARAPLLDHELHEFVARLPVDQKVSLTTSKVLLRRAMRGIVPDAILDRRRKMGFAAPVGSWLRGPLRGLFSDTVLAPGADALRFVSRAGVERLFDDHVRERSDATPRLWALLMLELWFREVVRSAPAMREAAVLARLSA